MNTFANYVKDFFGLPENHSIGPVSLSREETFNFAHRLPDDPSPCKNIHGHEVMVRLTVEGDVDSKTGMVIPLSMMKNIFKIHMIDVLDHSLVLSSDDPLISSITKEDTVQRLKRDNQPLIDISEDMALPMKVFAIKGLPTSENMAAYFLMTLAFHFKDYPNIHRVSLFFRETFKFGVELHYNFNRNAKTAL